MEEVVVDGRVNKHYCVLLWSMDQQRILSFNFQDLLAVLKKWLLILRVYFTDCIFVLMFFMLTMVTQMILDEPQFHHPAVPGDDFVTAWGSVSFNEISVAMLFDFMVSGQVTLSWQGGVSTKENQTTLLSASQPAAICRNRNFQFEKRWTKLCNCQLHHKPHFLIAEKNAHRQTLGNLLGYLKIRNV